MSSKTNSHVISVLNNLIETCKDGQEGFQAAAEGVKNSSLKSLFAEYGLQRAQFGGILQEVVNRLGGNPEKGGSVSASLHRGWMNIKAAVTGNDESAIIAECERSEDVARDAYQKALKEKLPADIRAIVDGQFKEVQHSHDRIRSLEVKTGH